MPRLGRALRLFSAEVLAEVVAALVVVLFVELLARTGWLAVAVDDRQLQYLPIAQEIGRALGQGTLPLLAPGTWAGGAIAAEYQHGVFNAFELLCNGVVWNLPLSIPAAAEALTLAHLAVLAAGVVRLARARELPPALAVFAACGTATSGWLLAWGATNWTPALASFAWVPWAWWAIDRALVRPGAGRAIAAAAFLYLVLTAGWPFSDLMVALVTLVALVERGLRAPRALVALVSAWALGVALSAPALLVMAEYGATTHRASVPPELNVRWFVPVTALPGWILPSFQATWHDFDDWLTRAAPELTGGAVPWAGILAGVVAEGGRFVRRHRALLAFLALLVLLLTTPAYGVLQHSFRWLPLAALVLALLGAHGLDVAARRAAAGALRPILLNAGVLGAVAVAFVAARALLWSVGTDETSRRLGETTLVLFATWGALLVAARRVRAAAHASAVVVALASVLLAFRALPTQAAVHRWRYWPTVSQPGPFAKDVRYFQAYAIEDVGGAHVLPWLPPGGDGDTGKTLRPGNTMLHAGLSTVNGYSPFRQRGTVALFNMGVHGEEWGFETDTVLERDTGRDGLLGLAGVDGLVLGRHYAWRTLALIGTGEWTFVSKDDEGIVLRRAGAPAARVRCVTSARAVPPDPAAVATRIGERADPRVAPILLVRDGAGDAEAEEGFAPCVLGPLVESRHRSEVQVDVPAGTRPALVVFARPWLPGWRAELDGAPLPVEDVDLLVPAVRVPPGAHGTLVLRYAPRSLAFGLAAFGAGVLAIAAVAARAVRRRPRRAAITGT